MAVTAVTASSADSRPRGRLLNPGPEKFKDAFKKALSKLERKGEITKDQRTQYWLVATTSETLPVAGSAEKRLLRPIDHIYSKCKESARVSGCFDGEGIFGFWTGLVDWIIENWKQILSMLLAFIVFIEDSFDG